MNAVDLPIVATVVLLALIGLKTGLLKPISGIGGLIIGVILAVQYSAELAVSLEQNIEGETVRRIAAFAGIVVISTVASRIAALLIKKLLSSLVLGWMDHVAGALAGTAPGLVLVGTSVHLVTGANIDSTRDALAESKLAPAVTKASLVASTKPWCWQVTEGAACTDISGLFNQYLGRHISGTVEEFLGDDAGSLVDVVQTTLRGDTQDLVSLAGSPEVEEKLLSIIPDQTTEEPGAEPATAE